MKKLFLSVLAVAALASCTKDESIYTEQDSEIKMAPVTAMSVKAYAPVYGTIDGTKYPDTENFDVRAYWANQPAGSTFSNPNDVTIYLGTQEAAVPFTQKGNYWGGTTTYYWPKNGSLRFSAYSPATLDMAHTLDGDVYTIAHKQAYATDKTIDMLIAPTTPSYTAQTATENVSVVFEHALSWITIKVKAANEEAAKAFKVHKVTVDNVFTEATLNAAMADGIQYAEWDATTLDNAQGYVVYSNTAPNGQDVTTETKIIESLKANGEYRNGTIVIPQVPTTLTIDYTQKAMPGTPALPGQSITIPLELNMESAVWEPGKHYIYTVIFDLDEILINPSVADWEDINVPAVEATAIEVNNEAELVSAITAGRSVRLINDITMPEGMIVDNNTKSTATAEEVVVELNGKTITYTGNDVLFRVNGKTLTINGAGKIITNPTNPGNGGNGYIGLVKGNGTINFCGGEYDAQRTCTIAQASEGTINVYSGTFKVDLSEYTDAKEEASYMFNCSDTPYKEEKAIVKIYGGSFYKFNPANNAAEGANTNFVVAGYNVIKEGDMYTVLPSEGANITLTQATTFVSSINVVNGTLDGANNTLTVTAAPVNTESTYGLVCPKGNVTVSNLTIDGGNLRTTNDKGLRGIYVTKAGNYVYNNVTVKNVLYPIHVNSSEEVNLKVSNSNLEGWLSYGTSTTADFTNVTFTKNNTTGNAMFRPYGTTVLTNCHFAADMTIDLSYLGEGETITFIGCTFGDAALKADNLDKYEEHKSFVTIK